MTGGTSDTAGLTFSPVLARCTKGCWPNFESHCCLAFACGFSLYADDEIKRAIHKNGSARKMKIRKELRKEIHRGGERSSGVCARVNSKCFIKWVRPWRALRSGDLEALCQSAIFYGQYGELHRDEIYKQGKLIGAAREMRETKPHTSTRAPMPTFGVAKNVLVRRKKYQAVCFKTKSKELRKMYLKVHVGMCKPLL
jgi:hypothetical protein